MTDTSDRRTDSDRAPASGDDRPDDPRRVPRETIERAVACIEPDWTVTGATPAEAGHQVVYLLTVEAPAGTRECVLKATAPDSIAAAGSEARLLAWLDAETAVPVPEVYGVVDGAAAVEDLPTPLFLMERVRGERTRRRDLETVPASRVETVARETGAGLAALHTLEPDRFGFLTCEVESPMAGARPSPRPTLDIDGAAEWPAFYRRSAEATLERVAESRFADVVPDVRPLVAAAVERIAADGPYRAVVAHIDGNLDNLLFDGTELTAMLDWEFTMAAPPAYDLVCMEWGLAGGHWRFLPGVPDRRATVARALLAGYAAAAEHDAGRVRERVAAHGDAYRLLAALRSMHQFERLLDQFGVTGDRREDAARALRERVRRDIDRRTD